MKLQGNPRTHDPRRIDTPKRVGALDLAFSHVSLVGRSKSQKFHTKLMPASALLGHEHQKGFSSLSDCDHTATHLPSLDLEMQGEPFGTLAKGRANQGNERDKSSIRFGQARLCSKRLVHVFATFLQLWCLVAAKWKGAKLILQGFEHWIPRLEVCDCSLSPRHLSIFLLRKSGRRQSTLNKVTKESLLPHYLWAKSMLTSALDLKQVTNSPLQRLSYCLSVGESYRKPCAAERNNLLNAGSTGRCFFLMVPPSDWF